MPDIAAGDQDCVTISVVDPTQSFAIPHQKGLYPVSPLAYVLAAIMVFRRDRLPTHEMSATGYAALAFTISLAFYYNAIRLFAFRTGLVDEGASRRFTVLDSPAVMGVVLALVFVGLTFFYGRERKSSELIRKFERLSAASRMFVNLCAALFLGAPIVWGIVELNLG